MNPFDIKVLTNESHTQKSISSKIAAGVEKDLRSWNSNLIRLGNPLKPLKNPSLTKGIQQYIFDWLLIFCSFLISLNEPIFLLIGLIITGACQRALSNLIHDASHWNLTRNKNINDFISNLLAGLPMISPIKNYRVFHFLHHKYLSDPFLDPDSKTHTRYKYDDMKPPCKYWYQNILYLIFNFEAWKDSNLGSYSELNTLQKTCVITWWVLMFLFITLFSNKLSIYFLIYWQLSRATTYHVIRIIAEFLDHSGLPIGSIIENTRLIKSHSYLLKKIIHPHNDHMHALHHLDPSLPNYNLEKAYFLTKDTFEPYKNIKHNDSYITGKHAALKDLAISI